MRLVPPSRARQYDDVPAWKLVLLVITTLGAVACMAFLLATMPTPTSSGYDDEGIARVQAFTKCLQQFTEAHCNAKFLVD